MSPQLFVDRSLVFTLAVNFSKHIEELLRLYNSYSSTGAPLVIRCRQCSSFTVGLQNAMRLHSMAFNSCLHSHTNYATELASVPRQGCRNPIYM